MRNQDKFLRGSREFWQRIKNWLAARRLLAGRHERQLRVCENLALGERRFLSVIECGKRRFLVGSSAHQVSMLSELPQTDGVEDKTEDDKVPTYKFSDGELTKDARCS